MNPAQQLLSRASAALGMQGLHGPVAFPDGSSLLGWLLQLDKLDAYRRAAFENQSANFFDSVLQGLDLSWECPEDDLRKIPSQGPLIIASNHPYGLADGLILGALLSRIRPDVKFLANALLEHAAPAGSVIPIDPLKKNSSTPENARGLRRAMEWLTGGGALVVFPAGEVAALNLRECRIREVDWKNTVARLARRTAAAVTPVHFHGVNSIWFHSAGLIHPRLRTALLPRELLNKRGAKISLRVAKTIPARELKGFSEATDSLAYLRWRTEVMRIKRRAHPPRPPLARRRHASLVPAESADRMRNEVEALPKHRTLASHGDLSVYRGGAQQMPVTLREIGRLRELSFREAGEGTGLAFDLDSFDQYYEHMFLWNHQTKEVIGAYRMALTDEVIGRVGHQGLYTSTLFDYSPEFFRAIGPSIELGRSFVRPEYQKSFSPLLLLWKGIGAFAAQHPEHRAMFGAVSISNSYRTESRAIIVDFLRQHHWDERAGGLARSRRYHPKRLTLSCPSANPDHLSDAMQDLEGNRKGIPVLLRQYLNLGGKAAAFHVDRKFSDTLDVLVLVDLTQTPARALDRYMGKRAPVPAITH